MTDGSKKLPDINFAALGDALLPRARELVELWLPGGKLEGDEWIVHSIWRTEKSPSLKVSISGARAGKWADFGGDDRGNDLVSLYAAVYGLSMGAAAVQLAREFGLEREANIVSPAPAGAVSSPSPRPPPAPAAAPAPRDSEGWKTVMPVPDVAPIATFKHQYRSREDITHKAEYRVDQHLLGYVIRFRTSTGGKDTLPYTWCVSARDGAAKWHWKQWDDPRPLYYPGHAHPVGRTVIVVEGEKKADALHQVLQAGAPGVYCVASWPGGCKAWSKALWTWLAGSTVLLWPDCDAKREKLTKAERAMCADDVAEAAAQAMKPLLPEGKQPGMAAMLGIGFALRDEHGCSVQLLPIPKPGDVADGWDCDDAINADGWDFDRIMAFFAQAGPLPADASATPPAGGSGGKGGGAEPPARDQPADAGEEDDAFREHLEFICKQAGCKVYELGINRKLLITALRKAPALEGCLGFDELRNAPCTRRPWPWRAKAGPLADADSLRLGDWLTQTYGLKAASKSALDEAIDTVADANPFHPIRDWLRAQKRDDKSRIDKWLIHVLGLTPDELPPRRRRYMELVGRYWLLGLVARVMKPGCKFDYSPVLEGVPGVGKSTFAKELVGEEFFSDTHFDIGNGKDGMEQLEGLWVYELSEMTAFRRADSESVKQFFSSTVDRFRGAYGRFVQPHPRQCVIVCTTNKRVYLYDLTGNRRFWPMWIDRPINLEWLRKFRHLLFAEAYELYMSGERFFPTHEEEDLYFVPEQEKRLVETAVQSRLYDLLTREGAVGGEGKLTTQLTQHTKFVTLTDLVAAMGADAAKSTSLLENQIRSWLEAYGWIAGREGGGARRRGYKQPDVWPPVIKDDEDEPAPVPDSPIDGGPPARSGFLEESDDEPF